MGAHVKKQVMVSMEKLFLGLEKDSSLNYYVFSLSNKGNSFTLIPEIYFMSLFMADVSLEPFLRMRQCGLALPCVSSLPTELPKL